MNINRYCDWTAEEITAIDVLRVRREVVATGGAPNARQKEILRGWGGWGTIPRVFETSCPSDLRATLCLLTTREEREVGREYAEANAHWTPVPVAEAIWDAILKFADSRGLSLQTVLEPASGIGEFLRAMPDTAKAIAVEIDPVTATIAQLLHPEVEVRAESFTRVALPEDFFDLAIGNLPFGMGIISKDRFNPFGLPVAEHCILAALRVVRAGGLLAFIVPRRVLDSPTIKARSLISRHADLIAALRFPSHRMEVPTGPGVVADLLIFRKRKHADSSISHRADEWLYSNGINNYFHTYPERVLGTTVTQGKETFVIANNTEPYSGLAAALGTALNFPR